MEGIISRDTDMSIFTQDSLKTFEEQQRRFNNYFLYPHTSKYYASLKGLKDAFDRGSVGVKELANHSLQLMAMYPTSKFYIESWGMIKRIKQEIRRVKPEHKKLKKFLNVSFNRKNVHGGEQILTAEVNRVNEMLPKIRSAYFSILEGLKN